MNKITLILILFFVSIFNAAENKLETKISSFLDDVFETQTGVIVGAQVIIQHRKGTIGAYRMKLDVPQNAIISQAYIVLRFNWGTGLGLFKISMQDTYDSASIYFSSFNISKRAFTNSVQFTAMGESYGDSIISTNLAILLREITVKSNWKSGNHILFRIQNLQNTSVEIISYEGTPNQPGSLAASLFIKYQNPTDPNLNLRNPTLALTNTIDLQQLKQKQQLDCRTQSSRKPVIFVIDDLQSSWLETISVLLIETHINEEVPVLLNVIPNKIDESYLLQYVLNYWEETYPCLIEIGEHGFTHQGDQYRMDTLGYQRQLSIIKQGLKVLKKIGLEPKSFTPPSGKENQFTYIILNELGFHTSIDWYRKNPAISTQGITLFQNIFLCQNSDGNIAGPSCKLRNSTSLQNQIDKQIEKLGYSCIGLHVQDFITLSQSADRNKINYYTKTLQELKALDKYEFILPEQYYQRNN